MANICAGCNIVSWRRLWMGEWEDLVAMRRIFRAVEQFMKSAQKVTKRSFLIDTETDSLRYQASKKEFERSKDMLLGAIDAIEPNSKLAGNMEALFNIPNFRELFEAELQGLKSEVRSSPAQDDLVGLSP